MIVAVFSLGSLYDSPFRHAVGPNIHITGINDFAASGQLEL